MKTTERFDKTVTKLYNAFNDGTLDAMNCEHCAAGNLCNNTSDWSILRTHGFGGKYLAKKKVKYFNNPSDYSPKEILTIESLFLYGKRNTGNGEEPVFFNTIGRAEIEQGLKSIEEQRHLQFKGLMSVVEYLASLDGIEGVPQIVINDFEKVLL